MQNSLKLTNINFIYIFCLQRYIKITFLESNFLFIFFFNNLNFIMEHKLNYLEKRYA